MKKILVVIMTLCGALSIMAQGKTYTCSYEMSLQVDDQLGSIADEQMRSAIAAQLANMKMYFNLTYSDGVSLFAPDKAKNKNPFAKQDEQIIYCNYETKKKVNQESLFGRTFLINEDLESYKWELSGEQKKIGDRVCNKATLSDQEDAVVAWYSAETPIPAGPIGFYGLPGLIVRLEMSGAIYTLTDITVSDQAQKIEAPRKGKKITRKELTELTKSKMQQMGASGSSGVQIIQMN